MFRRPFAQGSLRAVTIIVLFAVIAATPAAAVAQPPPPAAPAGAAPAGVRVLLAVEPGLPLAAVDRLAARHAARVERWLPRLGLALLVTDAASAERAAADLAQEPQVDFAGPHEPTVHAADTPLDEHWDQQWGMVKVGGPAAWDLAWGKPGAAIAIIDSGVQHQHLDLAAQMWFNPGESALDPATGLRNCNTPLAYNGVDDDGNGYVDDCRGYDFSARDNDPRDAYGHGTVVAGIAAAATNNPDPFVAGKYEGVAGMARQASIMALRGLDQYGKGYALDLAEAIDYAVANGARVINLSVTLPPQTPSTSPDVLALQRGVEAAQAAGVLIVAAAGNENANGIDYPARFPGVLAVGASTAADQRASFSNYGTRLDLLAPGASIYAPLMGPGNATYGYFQGAGNGTSFAAPHAAGVAALIRGLRPDLSAADVVDLLRRTADDLPPAGPDPQSGAGRLNAAAAVAEAVKGLTLKLTADPPGTAAGGQVTLRAQLLGPGGQPAGAGARVAFAASAGTLAPATATAGGTGAAVSTLTAPASQGVLAVSARLGSLAASVPVTVSSGLPASVLVLPVPVVVPLGGTSEIRAEVRDDAGNAVRDGQAVTFEANQGALTPTTAQTTGGIATAHFTAPATAGQVTVQAHAGAVTGSAAVIVVGAGTPFSMTLSAAPPAGEAGGPPLTLSARVWDGAGGAAPNGTTVHFMADLGQVTPAESATAGGIATAQLRPGSEAGTAHVVATAGYAFARLDVPIAAGLAATVTVTAAPDRLVAGYNQLSQVEAAAVDRSGNPVPDGTLLTFATTLGQVVPAQAATAGGRATAQLVGGQTAGTARITATAPGGAAGSTQVTVAPAAASRLLFEVQPAVIFTGGETSRLKATVQDAYGNPVAPGTVVTFTTDLGGLRPLGGTGAAATLAAATSAGVAQADLVSGSTPGTANVRAETARVPLQALQVEIRPGAPATVTLKLQPSVVRPGGRLDIVASVADKNGNPVADGTQVSFAASRGALDHAVVLTDAGVAYTWLTAPPEPGPLQVVAISGGVSNFKSASVARSTIWLPAIRR